ncbi:hypothetical protein O3M35_005764 [Rhynocoris fuscipes]|uniref:FAM234A/B beta-propeller domain-containing protein n=1 Tax=Rhynocoris fuscipes TaxID=488301 RepID=A0AAW1DRD2_9HEMI
MGDYQRLQTEAEGEVQNAPQPRHNVYYVKPMSLLHRVAFITSILVCIVVVLFFIWGLPCEMSQCGQENVNSISWDRTLIGLELKGRMHLVGGNLIAILRGAQWGKSKGVRFPVNGGGVVALIGKTGTESYWVRLNVLPRYIDCSMSELFANGVRTCLVVGENGYLSALDPISGRTVWNIKTPSVKTYPQPKDIDVPIPIPDMDSDGIGDLVTLSRFTKEHHRLAFISGKTGYLIKEPPLSNDCLQVTDLKFDYATSTLQYTCSNHIMSRQMSYEVKEIKSRSMKTLDKVIIPEEEHLRFVEGNNSAGEHKVIVSNSGTCPNDCAVSVNVTDFRNRTIWSYHSQRAYIMSPVSLHFKHSISGFLLKIWQWHSPTEKKTKTADGISVELIKERIILITFNKSGNMHVVNASQTDIIQLCYDNECQPHLSFQTQSALIADLNGDGTQDLISYFVTYKANNDDPLLISDKHSVDQWELESRVRVVRLEAELPKLYEAVSKH